jgi:transcriptional regulator GlxA family with amidase domain
LPEKIAVFLTPVFLMMSFTTVIEAQRTANRMSGRALDSWHVLSKNGLPVSASSGIAVSAEAPLAEAGRYAHLIVAADSGGHHYDDTAVFGQLRRFARCGVSIGAIGLGTYLLARARLLDGYRCMDLALIDQPGDTDCSE